MTDFNRKLDRFTATILSEANAESERAMEDLQKRHDAAYSAAEKAIFLEVRHYVRGESARIRADSGRRISRHMLVNKQALYRRRGELAAEVFDQVRGRIEAFTRTPAYCDRLLELCRQALDRLAGAEDVKIFLRTEDMAYTSALAGRLPSVPAEFEEGAFHLGGLMAESAALGLFIDATFDSAMDDLNGHFAELFGLSLSDKLGDALPVVERTEEP